ncbi:c-type cytochrome [Polaromonas sp.]|uniref:c-type cytochrome n=1 Tax=Polaromonas sp. TaxID=1869339 RepID=UPI00286C3365|nr:c-type cytochrome [Polaromonas sp.]
MASTSSPPFPFTPARRLAALATLVVAACSLSTATLAAAPFEDSIAQRTLACTACHGPQGRAAPDGYYPRLAGKPAGYLYNQLLNFRDGRRHYGLMTQLLDPLSDAYLLEIAQYFSALEVPYPAPAANTSPPALLQQGERLVMQGEPGRKVPACVQCHGQAMTGVAPNIPGLLGLPRDYLNAQLGAWKSAQRRGHAPDCMSEVVGRLSLDDINAVASWLAAQPLPVNTHPASALPPLAAGALAIECGSAPAPAALNAAAPKARP